MWVHPANVYLLILSHSLLQWNYCACGQFCTHAERLQTPHTHFPPSRPYFSCLLLTKLGLFKYWHCYENEIAVASIRIKKWICATYYPSRVESIRWRSSKYKRTNRETRVYCNRSGVIRFSGKHQFMKHQQQQRLRCDVVGKMAYTGA